MGWDLYSEQPSPFQNLTGDAKDPRCATRLRLAHRVEQCSWPTCGLRAIAYAMVYATVDFQEV